jgi:hypothetical protein
MLTGCQPKPTVTVAESASQVIRLANRVAEMTLSAAATSRMRSLRRRASDARVGRPAETATRLAGVEALHRHEPGEPESGRSGAQTRPLGKGGRTS